MHVHLRIQENGNGIPVFIFITLFDPKTLPVHKKVSLQKRQCCIILLLLQKNVESS